MKSNSGPRIYVKNFLSKALKELLTIQFIKAIITNYSVKEAISRTGILSLLTMPQL